MDRKYFGTDGVRGAAGSALMNPEFIMKLAYAAGKVLVCRERSHTPTVLIGKDTRISGYMLEAALEAGFCAAGVHVLLTGPLPTPAVAYLTRTLRLDAGVMISASHNVFSDNGIKFFTAGGSKLDDETELAIESCLNEPLQCVGARDFGRARRIDGAADRYIEFCKSTFPNAMHLRGQKIVVDCANGAAYHIAPKVFHELGAQVITIGAEPDGFNINDQVGATVPQTLQAAVLAHGADYGIALDGDGDRLLMADSNGTLYNGDNLVYAIAKARHTSGSLKGGVVGTVMTNMAMENALAAQGIGFIRAKVGDRYVLEKLLENGWQIGGEASGHILCLDKHNTGDGIISALQVFAALETLGQTLAQTAADWQPYPQKMINVRISAGQDWQTAAQDALAQAQAALRDSGRVILRPSGTEPVVRVTVEAQNAADAEKYARLIAAAVEKSAR